MKQPQSNLVSLPVKNSPNTPPFLPSWLPVCISLAPTVELISGAHRPYSIIAPPDIVTPHSIRPAIQPHPLPRPPAPSRSLCHLTHQFASTPAKTHHLPHQTGYTILAILLYCCNQMQAAPSRQVDSAPSCAIASTHCACSHSRTYTLLQATHSPHAPLFAPGRG